MPSAPGSPLLPAAPLMRRLASLVYEMLLVAAVVLITGFLLTPLVSPRAGMATMLQIPSAAGRAISFAGVVGATVVYCLLSWTGGRRTLPMKTWRLALRRVDGQALGHRAVLLRYAACWIGPGLAVLAYALLRDRGYGVGAAAIVALNYLWALFDRDRQFLHDRLAGTRLVDERAAGGNNPPAPE